MGYDTREANLSLGLTRGVGGSRADDLSGYDSRSDFLEANALILPKIHGQTRERRWVKDERPWGWQRSSGPSLRTEPKPSSLSDASALHTVIADARSH